MKENSYQKRMIATLQTKTILQPFFLIFFILGIFACAFTSSAAIRKEFNYQGKLTDGTGTNVSDGAYDVVFKVYTQAGGGTAVWTESWTSAALFSEATTTITNDGCDTGITGIDKIEYTTGTNENSLKAGQTIWNTTTKQSAVIQSVDTASNYICIYNPQTAWTSGDEVTNRVYIKNGLFSTMVGSVTDDFTIDFTADTYYLGVTIGADSEMIPRKKIGSVPQAWNANNLSGNGIIDIDNTSTAQDAANISYNPASGTYSALSLVYGSGGGTGDALTVTQNGTGDLVDFLDGSTSVFKIADGGNITMNALSFTQAAVNPVLKGNLVNSTYMNRASGVQVSGKYAYVSGMESASLAVVDVSNPASPSLVGHLTDATYMNAASSIYVSGKYAYVTGAVGNSLAIIDISNPVSPTLIGHIIDETYLFLATSSYVSGRYAYVTGYYGSLAVVDISNPASPVLVGHLADLDYMFGAQSVYVSGRYAYVAGGENNSLAVVDVSNPASPSLVGHLTDATYMNAASSVYISGKYAYVAGAESNSLAVVDVSNPASPSLVGHLTDATYMNAASSIYVSGKYAYVGGYNSDSLAVVDISNPASPLLAGHLTDATHLNGPRLVYVSGKYAYVTGGEGDSLAILEIAGFDLPSANIGDLSVSTLDVTDNATIANNLYVGNGLNVGPGGIYSTGPMSAYVNSAATALSITQSGTGDIVDFKDGATSVFKIADGGNVTMNALSFTQNVVNPVLKGGIASSTYMDAAYSVHVSGKYAYVIGYNKDSLAIIDISNPVSPTLAGYLADSTNMNGATSVYVSGKYAYVAGKLSDSLAIVDISNPAFPVLAGSLTDFTYMYYPSSVYVSGKYAYVAGKLSDSLAIVDISNPAAPVLVGHFANPAHVSSPTSVYVSGKYAYITGEWSHSLAIVDISNPAAPVLAGSVANETYMYRPSSVYVSGKYAYVTEEYSDSLAIVDISNPASPTLTGYLVDSTYMDGAISVYVSGKYAYVAGWAKDSLAIVDISNPASPALAGSLVNSTYMDGANSVYVSGKYAYITGGVSDSLAIVELSGFDLPTANIGDLNVSTIDVTDNASINNNLYVGNGLNVGPGGIYSSGVVGIYTSSGTTALTVNQSGTGPIFDVLDTGVSIFKVGQATIEMTRPLDLQVEGDVGLEYDLRFLNTSTSYITSSGPLIISAGDRSSYEHLTLTTAGTGDVIIDIASSSLGFRIIGSESKVFSIDPSGNVIIGGVDSKDADLTVKRNISTQGGNLNLNSLSTPTGVAVTPVGTAGTTTYGYRISALNGNGETLSATHAAFTTGNATLSSTNYNRITWSAVTGATGYKVYGRTSNSELYMATVNSPTLYYNDTGTVTPSGALPTTNTTGGLITYPSAFGPRRSIVLTAAGAETPTINGPAQTKVSGVNHSYYVLDFDAATDENSYWHWTMPDSYDGGAIDITYYWGAAATTGDVIWCFQSVGITANSAESIDTSLSTAVCETDTAQSNSNDLASVTETQVASNFGPGDYVAFKVYRDADAAGDTMSGDARLINVKIEYSVNAESD